MIPVEDALARLSTKSGREHFERREVLEKVQNVIIELMKKENAFTQLTPEERRKVEKKREKNRKKNLRRRQKHNAANNGI